MRQRVAIALSLVCNPRFLVADEPTTALDVVVQSAILMRLKELQAERGIGLLFISHDISVVSEVSDHVAVMYAGQIVEHIPVSSLFDSASHPYTIALMNSFPRLYGPKKTLVGVPGEPPSLASPPVGCRFAPRCPLASDLCRSEAPPLAQTAPGSYARCHYANTPAVQALRHVEGEW
jgi:peptide/nickel transport system ATP-binding protein